jgi:hypothetical protein
MTHSLVETVEKRLPQTRMMFVIDIQAGHVEEGQMEKIERQVFHSILTKKDGWVVLLEKQVVSKHGTVSACVPPEPAPLRWQRPKAPNKDKRFVRYQL